MPSHTKQQQMQYDDDPLTLAMRPPPNETEEERSRRLLAEDDAKRVSELIDEDLRQEKMARKRLNRRVTKMLLLGQSIQAAHYHRLPAVPQPPVLTTLVLQVRQRAGRAQL